MSFSQDLLYLLLLYAVLDRGNKLSLNTGLIIAFGILLFNCYFGNRCCNGNSNGNATTISNGNPFSLINNF
ncbi:MAG: hypothetical protein IKC47_03920 [Clostridia bacterium]|nr:hypothetical protein [Clostridia bacterium]